MMSLDLTALKESTVHLEDVCAEHVAEIHDDLRSPFHGTD
jgi:hypothetical protein